METDHIHAFNISVMNQDTPQKRKNILGTLHLNFSPSVRQNISSDGIRTDYRTEENIADE